MPTTGKVETGEFFSIGTGLSESGGTREELAQILEPYQTERIDKEGEVIPVTITSTALLNDVGQIYAIATTERAIVKETK